MSAAETVLTVAAARRNLAQRFQDAGLETPDLDARILVGRALALDHPALVAQAARQLTKLEASAITALADRRLNREPVARIVGEREFWGLPIKLNHETLVPRPETETVVEAALDLLGAARARPLRIADLDTGSGALLFALLTELPGAHGVGTDISPVALDCARLNAATLGFAPRATFVACDHGAALRGGLDLVVANPPYVASAEIARLPPEVRAFDPSRALDGGPDGLSAYRAIVADARRILAPSGLLVLELGAGQFDAVVGLITTAGLMPAGDCRPDLAGIPRALAAVVPP
jgi:release factor glutamine methyltransferase